MTKTAAIGLSLAISVAGVTTPALAKNTTHSLVVKTAGGQKCNNLTARIDALIIKIDKSLEKQTATYDKQDAIVNRLIVRAKAANIDTTKTEADLNNWIAQTNQIKTAQTNLLADLNNLKSLQCTDQKAQFKQVLSVAKTQLSTIKDLQTAKKTFFATTLKIDLQQLSLSLKQKL